MAGRRKRAYTTGAKFVCGICGKKMRFLSATHLKTHGMSVEEYKRINWAEINVEQKPTREITNKMVVKESDAGLDPQVVAGKVLRCRDAVGDFTDEVANILMSGSLKQQLAASVTSLLHQRMVMHGEASAFMNSVRGELNQTWRLERGGECGKPTPSNTLVSMGYLALSEVRQAEDFVLRSIKTALEEMKENPAAVASIGGFTGRAERAIPIPGELSASERETIRVLHAAIVNRARKVAEMREGVIDVTPSSTSSCNCTEVSCRVVDSPALSKPVEEVVQVPASAPELPGWASDF